MKNYIIVTLTVVIVFLATVIYKQQSIMVFTHFPVKEQDGMRGKSSESEVPLYLFLFFSKKNCASCLYDVVKFLNGLSPPFYVTGVVPGDELKNEQSLRSITGASFPLRSFDEYRRFIPMYTPTLIGVSYSGKIVFVLPDIAVQSSHLENSLISVYDKLYPVLGKENGKNN